VRTEIIAEGSYKYFIGPSAFKKGAGILQIRDYALESDDEGLLVAYRETQDLAKDAKRKFHELLLSATALNYLGPAIEVAEPLPTMAAQSTNQRSDMLARRLAVVSILVNRLADDPHFGRTKMAKLFYLVDATQDLNLETTYERQAAGPLDTDALYNPVSGLEALAAKKKYISVKNTGQKIMYIRGPNLAEAMADARRLLGAQRAKINRLIDKFRKLDTDQCEIVATLYACWNDRIIDRRGTLDSEIVDEFRNEWHEKKRRFSKERLLKALSWMRENGLVPAGQAPHTATTLQRAGRQRVHQMSTTVAARRVPQSF
jgi:hypothetical protein